MLEELFVFPLYFSTRTQYFRYRGVQKRLHSYYRSNSNK